MIIPKGRTEWRRAFKAKNSRCLERKGSCGLCREWGLRDRAEQGCGGAGSLNTCPDVHWGPHNGISIGHVSAGGDTPQETQGVG